MKILLNLALLLLMIPMKISLATEPCAVPGTLKVQVTKQFPKYRLPMALDNLPDDIAHNRQQGGDGCLGAASADFDGNGMSDYALLLTEVERDHTLLVAALHTKKGWSFEQLCDLGDDRARLYVISLVPGQYSRSDSLESSDLEAGELPSFNSKLHGLVTGTTESSAVAYFRTAKVGFMSGFQTRNTLSIRQRTSHCSRRLLRLFSRPLCNPQKAFLKNKR